MTRKQRRLNRSVRHRAAKHSRKMRECQMAVELARVDTTAITKARLNAKRLGGSVQSAFYRTTGFAQLRSLASYPPDFIAAIKELRKR